MNMFPCPTSSATKALVWFELRSGGLRMLAFGLVLAIVIYVLFALAIHYAPFRIFSTFAAFGTAPVVLLLFARNAFGIRHDKKRLHLSAFETTQPCGTAHLASVKLLVRTACVILALAIIVVGLWASFPLMSEWSPWIAKDGKDISTPLQSLRSDMAAQFHHPWYEIAAQVFAMAVFVLGVVAAFATLAALWARYPRPTLIIGSLLVLGGFSLGHGSESMPQAIREAIPWILTGALVITIAAVLKTGFSERALTKTYVFVAGALVAVNLLAYLPGSSGPIGLGDITAHVVVPLLIFVLAPWSFSRLRHT